MRLKRMVRVDHLTCCLCTLELVLALECWHWWWLYWWWEWSFGRGDRGKKESEYLWFIRSPLICKAVTGVQLYVELVLKM